MRIAHARKENMQQIDEVHGGAGSILFDRVFEREDFATDWSFIHAASLLPGGGIGHHRHEHCEEIFVTVDNAAQFTHTGRTTEVVGPAAVPLRTGETHGIYNHTDRETRWYNFHVVLPGKGSDSTDLGDDRADAELESAERLPVGRLDRKLLKYSRSHGGRGEIGAHMVWQSQDFRTNFGFLGLALLPPDTSVGYHRHDTLEECYIILQGSGRMTVDDETAEVFPGDVIPNRLGGSHGLYNHTHEELEILVVAVTQEKGKLDATNLGDELAKR